MSDILAALALTGLVLGGGVLGYMTGRWSRPNNAIICTSEQVVEAAMEAFGYPNGERRAGMAYDHDRMVAERIAAHLIMITEQKGEDER